jgi:hypothetical protein
MTLPRLRQLFGDNRWKEDVFACVSIRDQNSADIELMNAEIATKWLSESNKIEQDLSLIIHPIIDFIHPIEKNKEDEDDDDEIVKLFPSTSSLSPSNASDDSQKVVDNDPNHYIIKPDWRIVLTHPTFGDEYRKYIRKFFFLGGIFSRGKRQTPGLHRLHGLQIFEKSIGVHWSLVQSIGVLLSPWSP